MEPPRGVRAVSACVAPTSYVAGCAGCAVPKGMVLQSTDKKLTVLTMTSNRGCTARGGEQGFWAAFSK